MNDGRAPKTDLDHVGQMDPEAKVLMTIDMTEAMAKACLDGMRTQNPTNTQDELVKKLSERLRYSKRLQGRGGHVR